jgi:hypothetical protein
MGIHKKHKELNMESKLPVPTDNIYKFYSLFGLLIFLSCIYGLVNISENYNQKVFKRYVDLETLHSLKNPDITQTATINMLEKQEEIDIADKKAFLNILNGVAGAALMLIMYGFYQWHTKIQPQQDKILEIQIEKYKLETKILKKQLRKSFSK